MVVKVGSLKMTTKMQNDKKRHKEVMSLSVWGSCVGEVGGFLPVCTNGFIVFQSAHAWHKKDICPRSIKATSSVLFEQETVVTPPNNSVAQLL